MPFAAGEASDDEWTSAANRASRDGSRRKWQSAEQGWRQALTIARTNHNVMEERDSLRDLGDTLTVQGKNEEALSTYKEYMRLTESNFGANHQSLDPVIEKMFGILTVTGGSVAEKTVLLEKLVRMRQAAMERPSYALVRTEIRLIDQYNLGHRYSDAQRELARLEKFPSRVLVGDGCDLARLVRWEFVCRSLGKVRQSDAYWQKINLQIEEALRSNGHRTRSGNSLSDIAIYLESAAGLYRLDKQYARELELLQRALALRKMLPDNESKVAEDYYYIGYNQIYSGREELAQASFQSALDWQAKCKKQDDTVIVTYLLSRASRDIVDEKYAQAERVLRRAATLKKAGAMLRVDVFMELGKAAFAQKHVAEGQAHFTRALETARHEHNDKKVAELLRVLCACELSVGLIGDAEKHLGQARKILEDTRARDYSLVLLMVEMGRAELARSNLEQARGQFKRALELAKELKVSPAQMSWVMNNMADAYDQAHAGEAVAILEQSLRLSLSPEARRQKPSVTDHNIALLKEKLAKAYERAGQFALAKKVRLK